MKEKLSEYNATGHVIKAWGQAGMMVLYAFFVFCIVFVYWITTR